MSRPDVHLWSPGREALAPLPAGIGECVACVRASPTRGPDEPGEDVAALVSWPEACVLVVADGVGGTPGGAEASRLVIDVVTAELQGAEANAAALQAAVLEAVQKANLELIGAGGGATTVLAAIVDHDRLRTCHAGDSELLVVGQRGRLKHQTVSHTPVGYGLEAGLLEPDETLDHEQRHVVSSWVGMSGMRVEVASAIAIAPRDTLVLASDGLWDNLHVEEVADLVRKGPLSRCAEQLLSRSAARMAGDDATIVGKADDLSIVLFRRR